MSDLILYETEDGRTRLQLKLEGGTAWLTQQQMAELFETSKQNVSLHIKNVFEERELLPEAVVKDSLTTAADGKRYQTNFYNLDVVLAIGYRVRSPRGTQFRRWATTTLREYVVKGFAMDDERLKDPAGLDYFDELLERVRDIRASEQRFYGKIRDLFALSSDYRKDDADAHVFFAEVQNKLLHAVTGSTAAELVLERSNADQPNMGLQSWKGTKVRKGDVTTGKNYLTAEEIGKLNRLVTIFLDQAALRVQGGRRPHAGLLAEERRPVHRLQRPACSRKPRLRQCGEGEAGGGDPLRSLRPATSGGGSGRLPRRAGGAEADRFRAEEASREELTASSRGRGGFTAR